MKSIEDKLAQRKMGRIEEETIRSLNERVAVLQRENSGLKAKLELKERKIA